jgi:hypothetical protein
MERSRVAHSAEHFIVAASDKEKSSRQTFQILRIPILAFATKCLYQLHVLRRHNIRALLRLQVIFEIAFPILSARIFSN